MPSRTIDALDRQILDVLQREGRTRNNALADQVHLSPSPCLRRVKELEADGIITGYRAELDREAVGLGLTVFVELKIDGHSEQTSTRIEQTLSALPQVLACHVVSGAADFLLEVAVPDLAAYQRFLLGDLLTVPSVHDVRSNIAIRTAKSRAPLPLTHLTDGSRTPGLRSPSSRQPIGYRDGCRVCSRM